MCARPDSPVAMSTLGSGLRSVETGFCAARTTIGSPLLMPPSMPPGAVRGSPPAAAGRRRPRRAPRCPAGRPRRTRGRSRRPSRRGCAMIAPASSPSSRVSHSDEEPRPTGMPLGDDHERAADRVARLLRRGRPPPASRASASGSGQRSGDGIAQVAVRPAGRDAGQRVVGVGEGAHRAELVDEATRSARRRRRAAGGTANRQRRAGRSIAPRHAPGRRARHRCRTSGRRRGRCARGAPA